jgi:DNA-binding response OmpR family regulator
MAVRRVLVLDTNPNDRSRVVRELPADQFTVTFATTAEEASAMIKAQVFDAALIDIDAPDTDSVNLLRRLRREHPTTKIIMMTDCGDDELWIYMINEGATDLVPKSVLRRDMERLL